MSIYIINFNIANVIIFLLGEAITCSHLNFIVFLLGYNPLEFLEYVESCNNFFLFLVNTIVDVYTVEQLKVKASQNEGKADPFYGILYAYISTLNIDDDTTTVVRHRW